MERVSSHEETALNPDPFDLVESDFVARAVVRVGPWSGGAPSHIGRLIVVLPPRHLTSIACPACVSATT